ncbi:MAG: hypothetical protein A2023_07295 [Sulfuricurvum sp. GWF2_44_89]|uniref:DUF1294 domain-containing protein n=1 Tax=Sulfuricurvum kujiense TaxID=148813 RepID=A0A2D3WEL4_9BACT|nr:MULTISPECIES: DUF1294 domain-containing protein [Sulfuricurvum]OHD78281.1 MAG: hypothetical protein A2023_07295 [Sulfuricurvum sp. GWF2_44_89]OHD94123.1 MAG: hypothetical protein A2552_01625 [Sulfuricurvum sp. RIFOXYD2_FULL_44_160]OHD94782.1 MAG: hypothetical protein A2517_00035 [Sulfuricurvum sp. RIFOXYD12_FULL_44_77]DAB38868.1 MAG TPA: hypothetical protein CFH83_03910 [Sulfuricurvum kujiense]
MNYLIAILITLNLLSFVTFGIDKYLSIHKKRRISENRLLLLTILGGSVGSLAAQKLFNHKTRKFKGVLWVALLTHILISGAIIGSGY